MREEKLKKIEEELLEMGEKDQEMQERALEDADAWDSDLMKKHTKKLREIIDQIGWPVPEKVGREASEAAFLIAQHADHNPSFQEEVLDLLKELPDDQIDQYQIAYLEDRVRVAEGKDQLYGTQFQEDDEGRIAPYPIADEDGLDERREAVGLPSYDTYLAELKKEFGDGVTW